MIPEYRPMLRREWMGTGGIACFIELNPSKADDRRDDPTSRKTIGFAKRWGFRGFVLANLFAMRATDPRELLSVPREVAIGPGNDEIIVELATLADCIVVAWGDGGELYGRDVEVLRLLQQCWNLHCIGVTKRANPLHPCRAGYTAAPVLYPLRVAGPAGSMFE